MLQQPPTTTDDEEAIPDDPFGLREFIEELDETVDEDRDDTA